MRASAAPKRLAVVSASDPIRPSGMRCCAISIPIPKKPRPRKIVPPQSFGQPNRARPANTPYAPRCMILSTCTGPPISTAGRKLMMSTVARAARVRILNISENLVIALAIRQRISQRDGDPEVILRQYHVSTPPTRPFMVKGALNMARMWQKLPFCCRWSSVSRYMFGHETSAWQGR